MDKSGGTESLMGKVAEFLKLMIVMIVLIIIGLWLLKDLPL
jgi:hypothetical protein